MTLRQQLFDATRTLYEVGLNRGTSGNASVREEEGFLITPSGMSLAEMTPQAMVHMEMDGSYELEKKPSSEWRFHRDIYQARPEVNAVVHTHSMFATIVACLRKDVPPFHYMIATVGGDNIRCAPYALFGTQALSEYALAALRYRRACLLANHGMIALGKTLQQAIDVAVEVETLCEQYLNILKVAEPILLSKAEMDEVIEQFKGYGNWAKR